MNCDGSEFKDLEAIVLLPSGPCSQCFVEVSLEISQRVIVHRSPKGFSEIESSVGIEKTAAILGGGQYRYSSSFWRRELALVRESLKIASKPPM